MAKIRITREQIQPRMAASSPQRQTKKAEGASKIPIDIILLIDSSGSMEATDYSPTRFEAAREAAQFFTTTKIIKGHRDRVGIMTFGGDAQTDRQTDTTRIFLCSRRSRSETYLSKARRPIITIDILEGKGWKW